MSPFLHFKGTAMDRKASLSCPSLPLSLSFESRTIYRLALPRFYVPAPLHPLLSTCPVRYRRIQNPVDHPRVTRIYTSCLYPIRQHSVLFARVHIPKLSWNECQAHLAQHYRFTLHSAIKILALCGVHPCNFQVVELDDRNSDHFLLQYSLSYPSPMHGTSLAFYPIYILFHSLSHL